MRSRPYAERPAVKYWSAAARPWQGVEFEAPGTE
jgi:hypothetical protein